MRNKEFDVVRELMDGPWQDPAEDSAPLHALRPASFREIDGRVLASQYVAHRKLAEAAARSQLLDGRKPAGEAGMEAAQPRHVDGSVPPARNGRLASWARRFLGS